VGKPLIILPILASLKSVEGGVYTHRGASLRGVKRGGFYSRGASLRSVKGKDIPPWCLPEEC